MRRRSLLRRGHRRRERQDLALGGLGERYTVRWRADRDGLEIDFPKGLGGVAARERVVDDLARIEPDWKRLLVVYPREGTLRRKRR